MHKTNKQSAESAETGTSSSSSGASPKHAGFDRAASSHEDIGPNDLSPEPITGNKTDSNGPLPLGSVVFQDVSKRFKKHTSAKRSYTTLKSSLLERIFTRSSNRSSYVHALRKVTLNIPAGKAIGVIGKNGSGKSTLLKLIAGIYRPDRGVVKIHGKISALIELGAGFHPDFTGRENIYLGGVMFGLSRAQIDRKYDDIVRFAELEDFIDDPVRTYSSGMYMRLGFSLAIHTDPDILLVDEVLAVGDASFIHRCQERISDFKRRGKTLIFVTHDLDSVVRWCDEVVWLQRGRVKDRGEPRRVVDHYLSTIAEEEKANLRRDNEERALTQEDVEDEVVESTEDASLESEQVETTRWGSREAEITRVRMFGKGGEEKWLFDSDESIDIVVDYVIREPIEELVFGVGILRADGSVTFGTNTAIEKVEVPLPDITGLAITETEGRKLFDTPLAGRYSFRMQRTGLVEDTYYVDLAMHRGDGTPYDYHHLLHKFGIRSACRFHGVYHPPSEWGFEADYPVRHESNGKRAKNSGV